MDPAPEIVAATVARDAEDHARAMEGLSDKQSFGETIAYMIVVFVSVTLNFWLKLLGVTSSGGTVIMYPLGILAAGALLVEMHHLRRRLKAVTYLLLELDSKSNRS
jgi:hypothetical protein